VETKPKLKDAASKRTTKTKMARASYTPSGGGGLYPENRCLVPANSLRRIPQSTMLGWSLKHYPEGNSSSRAVGRGDLGPSVAAKRYDKQYLFVIGRV
jgi:hypothetical protein